jgi:hypothetical protein
MRDEVIEKLAALITAAFGLVAALAWNGAIQELFKRFVGESATLFGMILYATGVTVIAVVATIWVGKLSEKVKKKKEEKK